jgi:diguanylate cyclase (GGDEF)-like protein
MKPESSQLLQQKLNELINQARLNERKLKRFQDLELRITAATSLFDLLCTILYPDNAHFKWDRVSLLLLDSEYEIRRVLEQEGIGLTEHPGLIFETEQASINSLFPPPLSPMLEQYRAHKHGRLFAGPNQPPKSLVLLPLLRHRQLIGCLNIGSFSEHRFVGGMNTDFLEHLTAVLAICLENATNLERLKRQGLTDPLTAINNRRFFDQRLTEEMAAARRDQLPLACLMLDIDHFKVVNDNHGHQTGDQVLREVATLIRAQLRSNDVLCRYGGEEFAALLPGTEEASALEVAERIRKSIASCTFTNRYAMPFNITVSIGVAIFDPEQDQNAALTSKEHATSEEQLMGQADDSLYQCKATGRNRVLGSGWRNPSEAKVLPVIE